MKFFVPSLKKLTLVGLICIFLAGCSFAAQQSDAKADLPPPTVTPPPPTPLPPTLEPTAIPPTAAPTELAHRACPPCYPRHR